MNETKDDLDSVAALLDSDHSTGAGGAALLLLEYGDYECPSCSESRAGHPAPDRGVRN